MDNDADDRFHFDPESYMEMILSEIPAYLDLQEATVEATAGVALSRILELGVGTGETSALLVAVHPEAHLTGIDESGGHARSRPGKACPGPTCVSAAWRTRCPPAPTTSSCRHWPCITSTTKQRPTSSPRRGPTPAGGRFVLADVIPVDPDDMVTPVDDDGYDKPSPVRTRSVG